MSENAFWCTLWLGLAAIVAVSLLTVFTIDAARDVEYVRAGYTRQTVRGCNWPIWVKDPEK